MVTARMPSAITADSVARWPGPVIFDDRIGSFASMAVSTTRRPDDIRSEIFANAPAGTASSGQGISRSDDEPSSVPKRSGLLATTMVCVAIWFLVCLEAAHAHLGLAVEPGLRDENGKQSEQDCEADHDDGADTHDCCPLMHASPSRVIASHIGAVEVLNW